LGGQTIVTTRQFAEFARECLQSILPRSGEVLYSAAATLRPGSVYLLGLNPGGSPEDPRLRELTIAKSLADLPTKTTNSYLDTTWVGRGLLQSRVIGLLKALDLDVKDVAASNLSFVRSKEAKTGQIRFFADVCWPVHEKILEIVKPRLVLAYGDETYWYLAKQLGGRNHAKYRCGHGSWSCRNFAVGGRFQVASVPHLSWYAISNHPEVVDWLKILQLAGA
jgi:hypothetical protein